MSNPLLQFGKPGRAISLVLVLLCPCLPASLPQGFSARVYHGIVIGSTPESVAQTSARPLVDELHQALVQLGIETWHEAGFRGKGVKVAILDSGFHGYRAHLGHALPARVTARSFRSDGDLEARDSQHGILCCEVVHALAPEAELLLANWEPDRPETFLAAVRWARQQGARVITCSMIMPAWSDGEGNGCVHERLRKLLGPDESSDDALCFAGAGNVAQRHWTGHYHPGPEGWHEWQPGRIDNHFRPWGRDPVAIELCWPAGSAFSLSVCDRDTGAEPVTPEVHCAADRCTASVRFVPGIDRCYVVRVRHTSGTNRNFHLTVLGGKIQYATARGSIPFPADGPEVIAVGAVDQQGRRWWYSSCGPNSRSPKPDLVAVVPFPSAWRPRPFAGTSAAAPQAAALAALLWSRHPNWSARRIREALQDSAIDLGPPGHDCETGYGLIHLP